MTTKKVPLVGAIVLCAGAAFAAATPQELCNRVRVQAWSTYLSCVDAVVAKDAQGASFDEFAAFARCRHKYYRVWTGFQTNSALASSACTGSRLTDAGNTVTDNLTGLVWEKKTPAAGLQVDFDQPQLVNNVYTWSTGAPYMGTGTAFTSFLSAVNSGNGFAGANDWRLPTLAELQTLELDFASAGSGGGPTCSCGANPCIDGVFGPTSFVYWSATAYAPTPGVAWVVLFSPLSVGSNGNVADESATLYVRAVRGGF